MSEAGLIVDRPRRHAWLPSAATWLDGWLVVSVAGAMVITLVDVVLMERRFGVLRGGFLVEVHLAGAWERTGFVLLSLLADAIIVGALAGAALWILGFTRLSAVARRFLAFMIGVLPLAAYDLVSYELLRFLGDAFDLGLMFDLVGRNPREFLAVGAGHLQGPLLALGAGVAALAAVTWLLQRRFPSGGQGRLTTSARLFALVLTMVLCGTVVLTAVRVRTDTIQTALRRKPSAQLIAVLVNQLTDFDGDGVGVGYLPADPAPFNAAIRPYAIEIVGNGVDEDGVAGDLTVVPPARGATGPATWTSRPDVVLVLLESVRADAVGVEINGHPVTPVLDALATRGARATRAYSHNGFTYQSRYHLFTGSLAAGAKTSLIDDFKANGYQVGYISGQDDTFGGPALSVGFERADTFYDARSEPERRYTQFRTPGSLAVPAAVVTEQALAFLRRANPGAPLFLYINFHDTHFPYHHAGLTPIVSDAILDQSAIGPGRALELREMYLNTVANVDREIGTVLQEVERVRARRPAVIVTSDHGESLFDGGFLGHGYALNDAQTRVPFVAAGLALELPEPFGHADVRSALMTALACPDTNGELPRFPPAADSAVLQYLGSFERPRQIGLLSREQQTLYDFRTDRAIAGAVEWRQTAQLAGSERDQFTSLVHRWEATLATSAALPANASWCRD